MGVSPLALRIAYGAFHKLFLCKATSVMLRKQVRSRQTDRTSPDVTFAYPSNKHVIPQIHEIR